MMKASKENTAVQKMHRHSWRRGHLVQRLLTQAEFASDKGARARSPDVGFSTRHGQRQWSLPHWPASLSSASFSLLNPHGGKAQRRKHPLMQLVVNPHIRTQQIPPLQWSKHTASAHFWEPWPRELATLANILEFRNVRWPHCSDSHQVTYGH